MGRFFKKIFFLFIVMIYILLFLATSPIFFITFYFIPSMKKGVLTRFIPKKFTEKKRIIVHTSSAGEANLAYNIFKDNVNYTYFNDGAFEILKSKKIEPLPIPFESVISILLFIISNKYEKIIIIEQEIWPIFILLNKLFKKKLILLNCNMYEKSFYIQKKIKFIYAQLFSVFDMILIKSEDDKNKLLQIDEKLSILNLNNFKILSSFNSFGLFEKEPDNSCKNSDIKIILFSSIHPEEFELAIYILKKLKDIKKFKFIIAPRHLEKIRLLTDRLNESDIPFKIYSEINFEDSKQNNINTNKSTKNYIEKFVNKEKYNQDLVIIDKFGVLPHIYKYADLSIIGGSFNNKGGQNFIESILQCTPVIIGPSYENFTDLMDQFKGPWLNVIEIKDKNKIDIKETGDLIIKLIIKILIEDNKDIYKELQTKILQLKKIAEKQNEYISNFLLK